MKKNIYLLIFCSANILLMNSCYRASSAYFRAESWPVSVSPDNEAVKRVINYVRFTGNQTKLSYQEKALFTFLSHGKNIEKAIGRKNRLGGHQWFAAEIYRVDPGKHISVLCENGYQQTAIYFRYDKEDRIWFRVGYLGSTPPNGVPALLVK